ncbi:Uncharacterized membrane protein HdeD, DUF308 family [Tistlia consotensis]|uniref:Uncharacterized membrane protein HdeD, DUF308 family n=1 Tax=Tistlia consotensis USBA 355 TaxID=560819 RepID=A0A1Y6CHU5_9PROT|nr:DUF308 domain-containing protein [Tistlia consotensis]SMF55306.1 Uncharacterized membrane protein HdeD, DUF308 family [Tistlia consotensis USBA 355]SNR88162.1 Uncharacterized membrane protein HdeD, DUF308 family [Tistlia consotensis]
MSGVDPRDPEALRAAIAAAIRTHWKLYLGQGLFLMLLGLAAAALPQLSTLAITVLIGVLFLVGGSVRLVVLTRSRHSPGHRWSLLTSLLAIVLGLVLLIAPLQGVLTLTLIVVALLLLQGAASIAVALEYRKHLRNWGWLLVSGLVDLLLSFLIWAGWPATAAWAIGLLVGLSIFFLGLALVMTALAARTLGPPA